MKLKKFLIAGGNSTLLVWGCPNEKKNMIIKRYLGEVEQIGFVEQKGKLPFLNMMGGELCINGTIALASQGGKNGMLYTSGLDDPIIFRNQKGKTSIGLTLDYERINNVVLLKGIGFIYLQKEPKQLKQFLESLAKKYCLPAFGIILYTNKQLIPYVYVVETDSMFKKTACGSGSISLNILFDLKTILQPTGRAIYLKRQANAFTVTANVDTIRL